MIDPEKMFRARMLADLQQAQVAGAVSLSLTQMQAITNIATAIFEDLTRKPASP
jgi:hypothetical protein